jgi:hypothetical protein
LDVGALRSDGLQIEITEIDGPGNVKHVMSRTSPPFTAAQLLTIDRDPSWSALITTTAAAAAAHLFVPYKGQDPIEPPLAASASSPNK